MRTFQTRVTLPKEKSALLDAYAETFAKVEHSLFVDLQKGQISIKDLKKHYLKHYGITARQFNSVRTTVEGKIQSLKEIQKQGLLDCKERLAKIEKRLNNKRTKHRHLLHQRKQRLQNKRLKLENDQASGKVRLCFGSKKLFRAQYHLKENGFSTHQEWLKTWKEKRASSFFLMGSKDETAGNQTSQATIEPNGTLTIKLRLPNHFQEKYLILKNIHFRYGQEVLHQAILENQARKSLQKEQNLDYKNRGIAITYRFVRDKKGWRIFVSTLVPAAPLVTKKELGVIGVDLNVDHLAVTETNRDGNPVASKTLSLSLYGKSANQSKALISDIAKLDRS